MLCVPSSATGYWCFKSKAKSHYDRQSVGQSVLCQAPIWDRDQFFFLLEIFFGQLRVCYFAAASLTRGPGCNLLLLLIFARAVPRDSRPYFTVPILETPPTWRARSLYLYLPGTGWPSYTPGHCVPFCRLLRLAGATVEVF
jgi:hypothetical protein